MSNAYIVSAVRTPIGKFMGGLSTFPSPALGALAIREAVLRAEVNPASIDEAFMGCVLQAGLGQNPARQSALRGGLPDGVGAVTINKVCGSGLKSIIFGVQAIKTGDADIVVAGGMESMSGAPFLLPDARRGTRLGHGKTIDVMIQDGLWDAFNDFHMGTSAELVAERFQVGRADMDAYSAESHRRAVAAAKAGQFKKETLPIIIPAEKRTVDADEGPREDSTPDKLARLKRSFNRLHLDKALGHHSRLDGHVLERAILLNLNARGSVGCQS